MACDPVAARLIEIAKSKLTEPKDALAAIREVLNRAGLSVQAAADVPGASQGQVLWDEFIQIHRRRVPELEE